MGTQQEYEFKSKHALSKGVATLELEGKIYKTNNVILSTSMLIAQAFQLEGGKKGANSDTHFALGLPSNVPETFDTTYPDADQNFPIAWTFQLEGQQLKVVNGRAAGTFTFARYKVNAPISYTLENGSTANIQFEADNRNIPGY
ncbi:hypothetical protein EJA72_04975 [Pseudomonas sp. PB120]|uniref:hypothetical protein n=1 Tax=Pseudomonas sp. PB120 TaxID=2494700 RepID=UPI0012FD3226|nr:hypothetical protein [Pseudomonas sp. PB120]MVV47604.1 hypothetical protein [Pseudomonas sp. PB120]